MNVILEIDELVLHGFPAAERHRIGDMMQDELARIIAEQGLPANWTNTAAIARLDGGTFALAGTASLATLGTRMAEAVYRAGDIAQSAEGATR